MSDPMPRVVATFDNGASKELFTFFPDEIQINQAELIDMTEQEASDFKRQKDVAYRQK